MSTLSSDNPTRAFTVSKPLPKLVPIDPLQPPHLGSVPYLNARPLTHAIAEPIALLEPARLARELAAGQLQAALVPLMEVLEHAHAYHIVDGIAIGSLNCVYSVVVAHMLPVVRMRTVALDAASKTSNQLVQVILEKYYRIKPRYVSSDTPADGQLIIGDPAIAYRKSHPDERYLDLSQSWHSHTGLPFVFAVWAVRKNAPDPLELARNLRAAAKLGLSARDKIAANHFEYHYLTENLYYHLGAPQKKAITTFASDLVEIGHLPFVPELSYL